MYRRFSAGSTLPNLRIRVLQLQSEFLDLSPWAVSNSITLGILLCIVRVSPTPTSPNLSHTLAKIDFTRYKGIRESAYRYVIVCLCGSGSLSPLVYTMATFALAKMLTPDQRFQQAYYSAQSTFALIYTAAAELIMCASSQKCR